MGLISELGGSPQSLLHENSESSLRLLDKYIRESSGSEEDLYSELVPQLCAELQVSTKHLNWLVPATPRALIELKLKVALSCFEQCLDSNLLFDLLLAISLYANKNVSWGNVLYSDASLGINRDKSKGLLPRFANTLISRFLPVSAVKYTTALQKLSGMTRYTKTKAQMPALGLRIQTVDEDKKRMEWKSSVNITVLSSVVLLMAIDESMEFTSKCASFILNVLDDSEPLFRAQGCFLLQSMINFGRCDYLKKSGLLPVFEESVKTCFSYLPQHTPAETSLHLLKHGAYPALFRLLGISQDTTYASYLEVLNNHLLSSISHVSGRENDLFVNNLLAFFFHQIYVLIEEHLNLSVLACFSRLNFVLSQTITNSYLIESEGGNEVVEAALTIQGLVLKLCISSENLEANELSLQHKFDFMGAWVILAKRHVKFSVGDERIKGALRQNMDLLQRAANKIGVAGIEEDLRAISEVVPEVKTFFDRSD